MTFLKKKKSLTPVKAHHAAPCVLNAIIPQIEMPLSRIYWLQMLVVKYFFFYSEIKNHYICALMSCVVDHWLSNVGKVITLFTGHGVEF